MSGRVLRQVAHRPRVRAIARDVAHGSRALSRSLDTPRETLLAVSELARRYGGDRPAIPEQAALTPFELRAFSQNGEDGLLLELLHRAGHGGRFFVEFGAGDGQQNNCVALADIFGWSGLFIEADSSRAARLHAKYQGSRVSTRHLSVTPDSVDDIFADTGVPADLDVLSIDVDGPDYAIWQRLTRHRPRIVIIEYDGAPGPERVEGLARGASITDLQALGEEKGYRLVHTEMTGNNAFFVRREEPGTYPLPEVVPLRCANHYLAGEGYIARHSSTIDGLRTQP